MYRNQFFQKNKNLNIPESELNRMYRIHEEQMMMEQMMLQVANSSAGPGGSDPTPTSFVMTFGIDVDADGNRFRFGLDSTPTESTDVVIDWGDGQTEEFSIPPNDFQNYDHPYTLAGTYTVNVTISNPAAILNLYADAND